MPYLQSTIYDLRPRRGFTLIELLIAMVILALLATIGIGTFQTALIKGRDAKRKSDLSAVAKSLEAYNNDYGAYPAGDQNGNIVCNGNSSCAWGSPFVDGKNTVYEASLPTDPNGYQYVYVSTGPTYSLYAYLQNGLDPAVVNDPSFPSCGSVKCNYKLTSSNTK